MRKLQIEDAEVMRIAIQQEIERSEESRYDHRLHGLLLVTAGQSCRAGRSSCLARTARRCSAGCNRFEEGGLDALREGERSGRPRTLDAAKMAQACRGSCARRRETLTWRPRSGMVRSCPNTCVGDTAWTWACGNASDLFRQMGFRLRKPRPQVAQVGSAESRGGKKNSGAWLVVPRSNCGVWMNVTSNNTARAAACGCRRKSRTRSCGMRRPASPWPASGRSV